MLSVLCENFFTHTTHLTKPPSIHPGPHPGINSTPYVQIGCVWDRHPKCITPLGKLNLTIKFLFLAMSNVCYLLMEFTDVRFDSIYFCSYSVCIGMFLNFIHKKILLDCASWLSFHFPCPHL